MHALVVRQSLGVCRPVPGPLHSLERQPPRCRARRYAEQISEATVLFCQVCHYAELTSQLPPTAVVSVLNCLPFSSESDAPPPRQSKSKSMREDAPSVQGLTNNTLPKNFGRVL